MSRKKKYLISEYRHGSAHTMVWDTKHCYIGETKDVNLGTKRWELIVIKFKSAQTNCVISIIAIYAYVFYGGSYA